MRQRDDIDTRGVKWMGSIPENWVKHPVKRHFRIQLGKMLQNSPAAADDVIVPYAKALHVLWGQVKVEDLPEMWASSTEIELYGVTEGDLLVCEGGEAGRAGILKAPPSRCIIQNALHRVRPSNSADLRFLQYVLHAVHSSGWFDVLCNNATISHFTREKLAELRIPIPPVEDQCAIAAFLDRETKRIDSLIAKKNRQIELLHEKRAALISRAVTRGLNPGARMKDSDIEWLGEIPDRWEARKLKNIALIKYGLGESPLQLEGGLPLIRATDIHDGKINRSTMQRVDPDDVPWSRDPALQTNDILVVRSGAYTGDSAIIPEDLAGAIAGYDMVLRATGAVPHYIAYALLSTYLLQCQIYLDKMRAAQPHLNAEELGNCIVLLPPKIEQEEIVAYLDRETARIDRLSGKLETSIDMLRECRTALISAAVTGKIDVREGVG